LSGRHDLSPPLDGENCGKAGDSLDTRTSTRRRGTGGHGRVATAAAAETGTSIAPIGPLARRGPYAKRQPFKGAEGKRVKAEGGRQGAGFRASGGDKMRPSSARGEYATLAHRGKGINKMKIPKVEHGVCWNESLADKLGNPLDGEGLFSTSPSTREQASKVAQPASRFLLLVAFPCRGLPEPIKTVALAARLR